MTRISARRWLALAVLLLLLPALLPDLPRAQTAPDGQITSMQGDAGLSDVEARRLRFLFWAYAVIWILISAYLVSLGLRLRAVRRDLARLRGDRVRS